MKTILVLFSACLTLLVTLSVAQTHKNRSIPDAELAVAARGQEHGKSGGAIYYFILKCQRGGCKLMTMRFRCEQYSSTTTDSSFRPEIWESSTAAGTLTVKNLGNQLEVQETSTDVEGSTKGNLLFGYSQSSKTGIAKKVTSFSGGWIMSIRPIKEVHTIEFVPFVGSDAFVQMDCNTLYLPGVDTTK